MTTTPLDVDATVNTHGWVDEVIHTPDIRLRSHRVTLTYNKMSQLWPNETTFFDFATWGTHTVGRVIRGDLPPFHRPWLEPVHDAVANHLTTAQLAMFSSACHEGIDRLRRGWELNDTLEVSFEEQRRVTHGISSAINALADYWGIDQDKWAGWFTKYMMGVELPSGLLRPGERVKGTHGTIGSPVKDYRDLKQRLLWIEGVIETHVDDLSLKTPIYTPEQEQAIVLGTIDARA